MSRQSTGMTSWCQPATYWSQYAPTDNNPNVNYKIRDAAACIINPEFATAKDCEILKNSLNPCQKRCVEGMLSNYTDDACFVGSYCNTAYLDNCGQAQAQGFGLY